MFRLKNKSKIILQGRLTRRIHGQNLPSSVCATLRASMKVCTHVVKPGSSRNSKGSSMRSVSLTWKRPKSAHSTPTWRKSRPRLRNKVEQEVPVAALTPLRGRSGVKSVSETSWWTMDMRLLKAATWIRLSSSRTLMTRKAATTVVIVQRSLLLRPILSRLTLMVLLSSSRKELTQCRSIMCIKWTWVKHWDRSSTIRCVSRVPRAQTTGPEPKSRLSVDMVRGRKAKTATWWVSEQLKATRNTWTGNLRRSTKRLKKKRRKERDQAVATYGRTSWLSHRALSSARWSAVV